MYHRILANKCRIIKSEKNHYFRTHTEINDSGNGHLEQVINKTSIDNKAIGESLIKNFTMKESSYHDMNSLINPSTTKSGTTKYYYEVSRTNIYFGLGK